jgi:aspartate/methionine/tyrosine aminotransferase
MRQLLTCCNDSAMSQVLSDRVAGIAESATLAVDAKAKALKAAGEPVIGFGAGEPDFPTPAHVVEAAREAASSAANHRYTPAAGLPELREAVAARSTARGVPAGAANVIITNGGKQAIFNAIATLINPGDEVLIQAPYWVTYPEVVRIFGGVPVIVASDESTGYKVTVEELEKARTPKTKMLLFVSPSNPTGAVYDADEIKAIGQWAHEHGLWVLSDDIYQDLVFAPATFSSIVELVPELAARTVVVDGVAKSYAMTGWRVGWMIGPKEVIAGATNLQSHMTSNVANVSQRAALAALTGPQGVLDEMRAAFVRRRDVMVKMLNAIDGVTTPTPQGAFYVYPSIKGLLGRELGGQLIDSSAKFADVALDVSKVAVVPGEAFGTPGYLRLSYALSDADLIEGITRLQHLSKAAVD